MTTEEMRQKLAVITEKYDADKKAIIRQYLNDNNQFKVGDIIKDNTNTIKITHWKYRLWESSPELLYFGTELKKDGTPIKRQSGVAIFKERVISHTRPE